MSEHESVNNAKLPLPFLVESPSATRDVNIQSFAFGSSNSAHTGIEQSFETFNLTTPRLVQHRIPFTNPNQHQMDIPAVIDIDSRTMAIPPAVVIKGKRQANKRNYERYEGKTIFFCGGRFLSSRAFWAFALSLFLLIAPSVLFLIFT
jgi:hypothetical protein